MLAACGLAALIVTWLSLFGPEGRCMAGIVLVLFGLLLWTNRD